MTRNTKKPPQESDDDKRLRRERLIRSRRFWDVFYAVDSASKLLARSERLAECECEAECYRDIEGPKVILRDTLEKFEKLLYEVESAH